MEIFDWFPDLGAPMRAWPSRLDAVERYAIARMSGEGEALPRVSGCWIVRATLRNKQLVEGLRRRLQSAVPRRPDSLAQSTEQPSSRDAKRRCPLVGQRLW